MMPSRWPTPPQPQIAFFGVERHGNVPALPHAFHVRPAAISDAVADGPHAGQLIEPAARGGHAGGNGVGIVGDVDGRRNSKPLQRLGQLFLEPHALDLRQIGRFLHHP